MTFSLKRNILSFFVSSSATILKPFFLADDANQLCIVSFVDVRLYHVVVNDKENRSPRIICSFEPFSYQPSKIAVCYIFFVSDDLSGSGTFHCNEC